MELGPWSVSDMWRGRKRKRSAEELVSLALEKINSLIADLSRAPAADSQITGTTYQGGPTPGIEIVGPDAAYQDDVRRG